MPHVPLLDWRFPIAQRQICVSASQTPWWRRWRAPDEHWDFPAVVSVLTAFLHALAPQEAKPVSAGAAGAGERAVGEHQVCPVPLRLAADINLPMLYVAQPSASIQFCDSLDVHAHAHKAILRCLPSIHTAECQLIDSQPSGFERSASAHADRLLLMVAVYMLLTGLSLSPSPTQPAFRTSSALAPPP